MIKNKSKFGELNINKLIIIILCVLVLLTVLMFIYKVPILEWLRNLPDYTYEGDKEIDYTKLSPDVLLQLGCTEKIALIGDKDIKVFGDRREIFMFVDSNRFLKIENLVVDAEPSQYIIKFIKGMDIDVGIVKDDVLTINKNIFESYDSYKNLKTYVSLENLKTLNGTHLISTRLLCRTPEEMKKLERKKIVLGKEVSLVLDDGEGRCKILEVSDSSFSWLKNYGLKNSQLEYYENSVWKNIENEIPNEEQIILREKRDDIISRKNNLKISYKSRDYELKLDSEKGLYFEISAADRYLLTKQGSLVRVVKYTFEGSYVDVATDIEEDLKKSFQDALSSKSLDLVYYNQKYLLYDNPISPFEAVNIYYGVDDVNHFYKSTDSSKSNWQKFEQSEHEYLYVDADYWLHMKQRAEIKQDLINACK